MKQIGEGHMKISSKIWHAGNDARVMVRQRRTLPSSFIFGDRERYYTTRSILHSRPGCVCIDLQAKLLSELQVYAPEKLSIRC